MSLETKSKSFLVHEIERFQTMIKEKDVEIALLKDGTKKLAEQPRGTVIIPKDEGSIEPETKPIKKRKFGFEKDEE